MEYKAYFSYYLNTGKGKNGYENFDLPIHSLKVKGGMNQVITVDNVVKGYSFVETELEQARTHNNIVLYLASGNKPKIMKAGTDLSKFAINGDTFGIMVVVEKFEGKKKLSGFGLVDMTAVIENLPQIGGDGLLQFKIKLPESTILYGITGKHYIVSTYEHLNRRPG